MIISDFYVVRVATLPSETNTPLIVDADTVLPRTSPGQFFQVIAWRYSQVSDLNRGIEHPQFAHSASVNSWRQSARSLALENVFGFIIPKASDHMNDDGWRY